MRRCDLAPCPRVRLRALGGERHTNEAGAREAARRSRLFGRPGHRGDRGEVAAPHEPHGTGAQSRTWAAAASAEAETSPLSPRSDAATVRDRASPIAPREDD